MVNIPFVGTKNLYPPPLHIKLGLVKNFVKAMDKTSHGFMYLRQKFPRISEAKIKEGIFVGPQIRTLMTDEHFLDLLSDVEKMEWLSFISVCKNFNWSAAMLSDYCWTLQRDVFEAKYRRKSGRKYF